MNVAGASSKNKDERVARINNACIIDTVQTDRNIFIFNSYSVSHPHQLETGKRAAINPK